MKNRLQSLFELFKTPTYSRTLSVLVILVLLSAIPLTVYVAQQTQETRQRAAEEERCPDRTQEYEGGSCASGGNRYCSEYSETSMCANAAYICEDQFFPDVSPNNGWICVKTTPTLNPTSTPTPTPTLTPTPTSSEEDSSINNPSPVIQQASDPGNGTGTCRDNPVSPPNGRTWKADCKDANNASNSCFHDNGSGSTDNSLCPANDFDPLNINKESSNWCYGFEGPFHDFRDFRCLQLVRPGCTKPSDSGCIPPTSTPTPTSSVQPTATPTGINQATPTVTPTPGNQTGGTPTATPTPTSTIPPTQLVFTIGLQGIGSTGDNSNPFDSSFSNKNPRTSERTLTVDILDTNENKVSGASAERVLKFDSQTGKFIGSISIPNISSNMPFIVKVKTDRFLFKRLPGAIVLNPGQRNPQEPNTFSTTLTTGDVDNNGSLNILDYHILLNCFQDTTRNNPALCSNNQKKASDLNDDEVVNEKDFNLLLRSLTTKTGD